MQRVLFEDAERALAQRLSPAAVAHSRRVAEAAAELASAYGADVEEARLAGLLHDWSRETDPRELLARAGESGIGVTPVDELVPYLLHAPVGAMDVEAALPGVSGEVRDAIARHTVGAAEMTVLDRVVYLADMIESARDFPGVDDLRASVGLLPLDELFARGYSASLRYIIGGRRHLHPDTVAVWNAVVAENSDGDE